MDFVGTDFNVAEEDIMNILPTDTPIYRTKLPTTKFCLPETGFVRLKQIIAPDGPIPVSRSTWWAGVKSGRYPQPVKSLGDRITAGGSRIFELGLIDRKRSIPDDHVCCLLIVFTKEMFGDLKKISFGAVHRERNASKVSYRASARSSFSYLSALRLVEY